MEAPDFAALFHGRDVSRGACISIGPESWMDKLRIEEALLVDKLVSHLKDLLPGTFARGYSQVFKVEFRGIEQVLPWLLPTQGSAAARTVERSSGGAYLYLTEFAWQSRVATPNRISAIGAGSVERRRNSTVLECHRADV